MADDANPNFLREFYSALSFCCEDLFFSRFQRSNALDAAVAEGVPVAVASQTVLDNIFEKAHTDAERTSAVAELLDVRISPATAADGTSLTAASIPDRMARFDNPSLEQDVRKAIEDIEAEATASKTSEDKESPTSYIDERLSELTPRRKTSSSFRGVIERHFSRKDIPRALVKRRSQHPQLGQALSGSILQQRSPSHSMQGTGSVMAVAQQSQEMMRKYLQVRPANCVVVVVVVVVIVVVVVVFHAVIIFLVLLIFPTWIKKNIHLLHFFCAMLSEAVEFSAVVGFLLTLL